MNKRQKVKFRRFLKPFISIFHEKEIFTQEERIILSLTRQYIFDPKSKLRIAPLSATRYIECDNVLIKINQTKLTIHHLNSKIDANFSHETIEKLCKLFDLTAENSRIITEYKYLTPIINKLKTLQK